VLRIASNVYRDLVRRESRLPKLGLGDEAMQAVEGREKPPGEGPVDGRMCVDGVVMERAEVVEELAGVMGQLQRADRDVLGSYYKGGQDCLRTAYECEIPAPLVKVRLFRARQRLLERLRRRLARAQHASRPVRRLAQARSCAWSVALCLGAFLPAARSSPTPESALSHMEVEVPRQTSAARQLEHARSIRFSLRGTRGAARERARSRAVRAYRAVRIYYANAPQAREAAFRAGELLRAAGDVQGARSEFGIAATSGARSPFVARALLELGHIERRARRYQEALSLYERVTADTLARAEYRDRASLWTGRVYELSKRPADAERVWTRVAEEALDPVVRVRAFDSVALLYVRRADPEGAAGVLDLCRRALADTLREETRLGERVRDAVSGMRAVDEIKRIVAERLSRTGR
jgi:tetratricopeptide (TPR) repeat protein